MGGRNNPFSRFWSSNNDRTEKVDEFSPRYGNGMVNWHEKGSPPGKIYRGDRSIARNYGKYDHFNSTSDTDYEEDDDDNDIICNDGVCVRNTKGNGKFAPPYSGPFPTQPKNDASYKTSYVDNNEKHIGNGYSSPPYRGPFATQPKQDTSYETSYDDIKGKYRGNGYSSPRYTGPGESQPRKDAHYAPSNNNPRWTGPPPIKTISDTGRPNDSANNSPMAIAGQQRGYGLSPRKYEGYPEIIDSAEARRRYARGSPRAEAYKEEAHTRVIDSRKAAEKYNGVLVPSRQASRPF